jgi:hypothetical protein
MKYRLLTFLLILISPVSEYSYSQNISLISSFDTPGAAYDVKLSGDYAFVADSGSGLSIIDISDPANPVLTGNCSTTGRHMSIAVDSDYAYIAAKWDLQIFDISDYTVPTLVGSISTPESAVDVFVDGDYAYVSNDGSEYTNSLCVIDISDKANPFIMSSCWTFEIGPIYASGDFIYMAARYRGLKIFDVSDKYNPFIIREVTIPNSISTDVFLLDDYAFIASWNTGMRIVDITNPYGAYYAGGFELPGSTRMIFASGDYAYITMPDYGVAVLDVKSRITPHFAGIYHSPLGGNGICARDSMIYVSGGDFYVLKFNPGYGAVSSIVYDADTQAPIESVTVRALPSGIHAITGIDGECVIDSLYNLAYNMAFSHPLYFDTTVNDVQIPVNDTAEISIGMVHRPIVDAGVSGILDIPDPFAAGAEYELKSEINNFSYAARSINFVFEVYPEGSSIPDISDTVFVMDMPGGSTDTLLFPTTFIPLPDTTYTLVSYSVLAGDENPSNDTTEMQVESIFYYYIFYGNPDGTPLEANIGSILEMTVWGATPLNFDEDGNGVVDSINFMSCPLASPDSIIAYRYPTHFYDPQDTLPAYSYFPFYPINDWDDPFVMPEVMNSPEPGLSTQSMGAFADVIGGWNPQFNSQGDTIPLFTFAMRTAMDTSLFGRQVYPFQEGFHHAMGWLLWGFQDGWTPVYPSAHYGGLRFYAVDELGYLAGTVSDLYGNPLNSISVSIIDSFREDSSDSEGDYYLGWITPGEYDVAFSHPNISDTTIEGISITAGDTTILDLELEFICGYLPGDVNGNSSVDGIDVVYLVSYLKGGASPPVDCFCPGHGILFVAADANGTCAVNGLDVTYMVSYFKGGPPIMYCADCPPQE